MDIAGSLMSLLLLGVAGVAGWGLWLLVRQHALVFKPSRVLIATPGDCGLRYEDVALPLPGGGTIRGWWIEGSPGSQAVFILPGTVGNIAVELLTVSLFASLGCSVLILDYPGFGHSDGKAGEAACYLAGQSGWRFLRGPKQYRAEEIVLFGRSLGCAVASSLAATYGGRGLVLHSGYTRLVDLASRIYPFFPVRPFCFIKIDSLQWVRQCRIPTLFLHPESDELIPLKNVIRLYTATAGAKRLLLLRGGHFGDTWRTTSGVREALAEVISGRAAAWTDDQASPAARAQRASNSLADLFRRSRRWWKSLVWSTTGRTK